MAEIGELFDGIDVEEHPAVGVEPPDGFRGDGPDLHPPVELRDFQTIPVQAGLDRQQAAPGIDGVEGLEAVGLVAGDPVVIAEPNGTGERLEFALRLERIRRLPAWQAARGRVSVRFRARPGGPRDLELSCRAPQRRDAVWPAPPHARRSVGVPRTTPAVSAQIPPRGSSSGHGRSPWGEPRMPVV